MAFKFPFKKNPPDNAALQPPAGSGLQAIAPKPKKPNPFMKKKDTDKDGY
jgi:hypothetical protein